MNPQLRVASEHLEVAVVVQNRHAGAYRQLRRSGSRSTCERFPLAAGNGDRGRRHPRSRSPASARRSPAPAAAEGSADGNRPAPRRVPPSARRRRWQSRPPAARRRECRPGNLCPAGTLSRPRYRPGSRSAAGTHRVEVAVPAGTSKRAGLVDRRGFGGHRSQREVDRLALGLEVIAPHDLGACPIVDIHVGACHTPIIHQEPDGAQVRGASPRRGWILAFGDLCVTPVAGDSVAEMASIPGGDPPNLDSRLRGKDGCSKVCLRGKDGCSAGMNAKVSRSR